MDGEQHVARQHKGHAHVARQRVFLVQQEVGADMDILVLAFEVARGRFQVAQVFQFRKGDKFIRVKRAGSRVNGVIADALDATVVQRDLVQAVRNIDLRNTELWPSQPAVHAGTAQFAQRHFVSRPTLKSTNRHQRYRK